MNHIPQPRIRWIDPKLLKKDAATYPAPGVYTEVQDNSVEAPPPSVFKGIMKLGKRHPLKDVRTPRFAKYLTAALPAPPPSVDYGTKVASWPMYGNDSIGDCTCAAVGHIIQEHTADESVEVDVPESAIITAYTAVSGYNPKTGANDNGAQCETVLNYWMNTGVAGHKIWGYAALTVGDLSHVKSAIDLFGTAYLGVALPTFAQNLVNGGKWYLIPGWDTTPDGQPGSWGGHCVPILGYDGTWLKIVTWGMEFLMSYKFFEAYCDEAYAVLSKDWDPAVGGKPSPSGVDLSQLEADLQLVRN